MASVVMFDAAGRVVVCNNRYLEIYRLSPDVVNPVPDSSTSSVTAMRTAPLTAIPAVLCQLMDTMRSGEVRAS